jgi:hypothetical protein
MDGGFVWEDRTAVFWEENMNNLLGATACIAAIFAAGAVSAFECKRSEATFDKPSGFQNVP